MSAVLGIDAAWTERQPSGVALVVKNGNDWRLEFVAPCYNDFIAGTQSARARGCRAEPKRLVDMAQRLGGKRVSIVAIDMPLSTQPIGRRRKADNDVSRIFGGERWAGTHSPTRDRPGALSDTLRADFECEGFKLATATISVPSLVEVYPHPALMILANEYRRLPYKYAKHKTCPDFSDNMPRIEQLLVCWTRILKLLDREIADTLVKLLLPQPHDPSHRFKAFEDMLDAVVCCWVGICALEARACGPQGREIARCEPPQRSWQGAPLGSAPETAAPIGVG